jgi:hypothetical protein
MDRSAVVSLTEVFAQVPDPRDPRGVRHPAQAILTLVFLGLLARIREMTVLVRWAEAHWDQLCEPLGFDRERPPHATTISRTLARCSLGEFSRAFARWVRQEALTDQPIAAAVDGKTSRQSRDAAGEPVQLLTVFVQQLKLVIGQWSVRGEKTNEPGVLKHHLEELVRDFPMLRLITGDAIYSQRPLAEVLVKCRCDYLLQVKDNQPDMLEALKQCLGQAHDHLPAAETSEKRGDLPIVVGCGLRWTTPTTSATRWAFPAAASRCASIAT